MVKSIILILLLMFPVSALSSVDYSYPPSGLTSQELKDEVEDCMALYPVDDSSKEFKCYLIVVGIKINGGIYE